MRRKSGLFAQIMVCLRRPVARRFPVWARQESGAARASGAG
jgi:hypothetical protein